MTSTTEQTPKADDGTELPSRIAGRYVVSSLRGRGGFGAVYEAFDLIDERSVAIKVIRTDANIDPRATRSSHLNEGNSEYSQFGGSGRRPVTRGFGTTTTPGGASGGAHDLTQAFKDEFRLLTQLHHANLAEVYDFGRCDELDGVYFTQELVEGPYLTEFFENASREAIVDVFVQITRALDYIHALGMVHEDIKPSNVLVTQVGGRPQAKLIDFGLARALRSAPESPDAEGGTLTLLGTPGFSAPEKVRGKKTDHRSDLYSLAATIYAAVRGQRAFPGKSFQEALGHQLDWRPELAGVLLQRTGPVVAELIGRMLHPDAEHRPQSARAVVLELLRREHGTITDKGDSRQDRQEFARVLVEHLPFVDRAGQLDILLTRANEILLPKSDASASRSGARAHPIHTLFIEAPEGMGKSRLLAEFRREIQLGGGIFVEGSCWISERSALGPFGPIVMQLASALGDRSPTAARFEDLIALARDRGTDSLVGSRLIEFLIAAAQERPYALHLSELSKAAELERIIQLTHALEHERPPIVFCCTTVPNSKLGGELRTLASERVAELWSLRPFTTKEMSEVLIGILGDGPSIKDTVALLDKLTGGHPLSFRETLRVLIEEQVLTREGTGWVLRGASTAAEELHKTLAQRSEARLDGLGVSAWEVASILLLIETPLDEDLLASLSDLRKERFRRTLERLEGEGLIVRTAATGRSLVSLAHESVREAVRRRYAETLDETRLDLAAAIDELESEEPNLIFLRARLLDDAATGLEGVDELEQAATALIKLGQLNFAAQVLDRMIHRLRRHGGPSNLQRLLDTQLRLLNSTPGSLENVIAEMRHYEAGVLISEILQNHRAESLFWLGLADRSHAEGIGLEFGLERLERAAEAAVRANDRVLSLRIANRRAEALMQAGEIEAAGQHSRQAMQIMEAPEATDGDISQIVGVRLRCLSLSGQLGEARRLHDMARPIAARVPVAHRGSYLSGIAFLAVLGGEPTRAIPETAQAVEELRAANLPRLLVTPLHNLGDLYLRAENYERAADAFRESVALASLYGIESMIQLNRGFLGYALARLGDVDQGAALLAQARADFDRRGDDQVTLQQLRLLDAEVAHMAGQSPRARRELEEMLADFHASNEVALAQQAQDALARIERDLGHGFVSPDQHEPEDSDPDLDTVRTKPIR